MTYFKANLKLPRGEFFFIQIGDRYYGGEAVDKVQHTTDGNPPRLPRYKKANQLRSGEAALEYRDHHTNWWSGSNRRARDRRKQQQAAYLQPRERAKPITTSTPGQTSTPRLVNDVNAAKQYRRKKQALAACERLEKVYGGVGAKVSVQYKGDNR